MKKKSLGFIAGILVLAILLGFLNRLFMPKYNKDNVPEGALIAEYYRETTDHDVLFIGDCEVYENFIPNVMWDKYGITSYIRGSAQQLIWQSYYMLEEMLAVETPKAVVFNALSMKYNEPQNEAYNRLNLDGMKLSRYKIDAIKASMTEEESMASYIFPLLRFHDRWSELSMADLKGITDNALLSDSGYLMQVGVKPAQDVPVGRPLNKYEFGDNATFYLDSMVRLCKEKGVELILIKAPSLYPYWYDQWDEIIADYAKANGLKYVNFLHLTDEIGIDYNTDTYDGGLHLNLYGAEKLSTWFGKYLSENCGIEDRRGQEPYASVWAEKDIIYNERRERLENEKGN